VTFLPSARGNEFVGNNFVDNIDQVSVAGRGGLEANRFWKGESGNFWSDYTGYDQNGDGVGDFVHESQTLFESMMDKEPKLRLFLFSPAQQAIEFVGRALPAVRPEAKFTDEVPLMSPVTIALDENQQHASSFPLVICATALIALGGYAPEATGYARARIHGQRGDLETRLSNQGIKLGSAAYDRALNEMGNTQNQAYNQLALQGRGQAFGELQAIRNQPLNELSALLSGSQVAMPNYAVNTPAGIPTTDNAALIQANYGQQMQNWQQDQQNRNSVLGGLFGLGSSAIMSGFGPFKGIGMGR
jgi:hypothetical protein